MIALVPIEVELRGGFRDLGLSLEIADETDHVLVKSHGIELTRVSGEDILATPRDQLVELFKREVRRALETT